MSEQGLPRSEDNAGIAYVAGAYVLWGFNPLYWRLLHDVSVFQMSAHRLLWCAGLLAVVALVRGRMAEIGAILRTPRTFRTLLLTSLLININWGLFMYSLLSDQLVESALGYYMTPLFSFMFGMLLLGERPSRLRLFCIGLAALGVIAQVFTLGRLPWIALILASTFALYGYLRKRAPVAALDGLLIETSFLAPVGAGLVAWWYAQGTGVFLAGSTTRDLLLMLGGPVTVIPLAMFAVGVPRVRMTTLAFLQYLAPTISLLLAVFAFGEPFDRGDLVSFALIWVALVIAAFEGLTAKASGTAGAA